MSNGDMQVPDGWEKKRLGDLFKIQKTAIMPNEHPDEIFQYFSIPAFDEYGGAIKELGCTIQSNKYLISEPTILVSKLNPRKPRVILTYGESESRSCASTEFIPYVTNSNKVYLPFYAWYIKSSYFHGKLELVATGSTNSHVRVTPSETLRWFVPTPPLPEQKKIASILTSVDDVIEKTEAQISKLQDLKKGMMTELLTKGIGHTEFKDSPIGRIPVEWKITTLGKELSSIEGGGTPSRKETAYWGGEIQWATVKDLTETYLSETQESITIFGLENSSSKLIPQETVVIATRMALGKAVMFSIPVAINQDLKALYPASGLYSSFLLYWYLNHSEQIESLGSGSTVKGIRLEILRELMMLLPPLSEQKKIVSIFTSIDTNIESKQKKLSKTKSLKKALMNDLLTGKVRVSTTTN